MSQPAVRGLNHHWSKLIIEELSRLGASLFVIAPGARSAPLTHAVYEFCEKEENSIKFLVHYDERGCGYYCVGWAQATQKLAVCITTSGTAVANLFPAVVESSQAEISWIIITADRPFELRQSGANQTINQIEIFGSYVRFFADIPPPNKSVPYQSLLALVDQAVSASFGPCPGPVHLNMQFRKPLLSPPDYFGDENLPLTFCQWEQQKKCLTQWQHPKKTPTSDAINQISSHLNKSKRGLIISGKLSSHSEQLSALALAQYLKWPILTDVSSNLRCIQHDDNSVEVRIAHHSLFLSQLQYSAELAPDCIIHLGDLPVSNALNNLLETCQQQIIQISPSFKRFDPFGVVAYKLIADLSEVIREITKTCPNPTRSALLDILRNKDKATATFIDKILQTTADTAEFSVSDWHLMETLSKETPNDWCIYLGNSLPIREADAFFPLCDRHYHIAVQRGASGIDGTLSMALGTADALKKPLVLIIGDVTFLHDINSLPLYRDRTVPTIIVVLNNNGGAIFSKLPELKDLPSKTKMFVAPHGLSFEGAAQMCALKYEKIPSLILLKDKFRDALKRASTTLIEVIVNTELTDEIHDNLIKAIKQEYNP